MSSRLRNREALLEAIIDAMARVNELLETQTNTGWTHDHVGVLNAVSQLLQYCKANLSDKTARRDLGRLVMDNDGADFPDDLRTLLLEISGANLRD